MAQVLNSQCSSISKQVDKKWVVVALSGVSCGGKTTIAKKLLKEISSSRIYISQDEYILPNNYGGHLKAPLPLHGLNKDSLHSIDMEKMIEDINKVLSTNPADMTITNSQSENRRDIVGSALNIPRPHFFGFLGKDQTSPVLILDGFLLLNHPYIPPLCNSMYFITLTKEECRERRNQRTFTAPGMNAEDYFELCMWPKYEEHFKEMCQLVKNITFINGSAPLEDNYKHILQDVMNIC